MTTTRRPCPGACTTISAGHGEPLHAHAPPSAMGWLLLEHPGPWGAEPAARNPLIPATVRAAAAERGLRLQLIRRPGRARPRSGGHACFLAFSDGRGGFLEHRRLDRLDDVLGADLDALAVGAPPGFGTPVDDPLVLVCTHGKVDPCCAVFGLPVTRALAEVAGEGLWETTHVGGCRFAANLICLPHGIYYGRLTSEAAIRAIVSLRRNRLELDVYRGRAGAPQAVQAAEYEVRRQEGLTGLDDLSVDTHVTADDGIHEVRLTAAQHTYMVRMQRQELAPRPYGCGTDGTWLPDAYRLVSLDRRPLTGAVTRQEHR